MNELNILGNASIKLHELKGQYMKESNILVGNATIKQHRRGILLNTKGLYMKESNILATNATIKQPQGAILIHIKGQHIKELDSHNGIHNGIMVL